MWRTLLFLDKALQKVWQFAEGWMQALLLDSNLPQVHHQVIYTKTSSDAAITTFASDSGKRCVQEG